MIRLAAALLLTTWTLAAEVQVDATVPWMDQDGWTPVIITVTSERAMALEVTATQNTAETTTVLQVQPGRNAPVTVLVPTRPESGGSVDIRWRGPGGNRGITNAGSASSRSFDLVLVDPDEQVSSKNVLTQVKTAISEPPVDPREPSWSRHRGSKSGYPDDRLRRVTGDQLPDRWQGYPLWMTLIVSSSGERHLTLGQRQAIAAWTRAGGRLLVDTPQQVAPWRALGARVDQLTTPTVVGRLQQLVDQGGFRPERLAVPGTGGLPVLGFTIIAVLFALLAGPGAMWWATRRGQRSLILVAVPVLSAGTCLVLVVYGLVADGLEVRRAVVQGLLLDQTNGRGLAVTGLGLFAGLAPGAFPLDPEERLVPFEPRLFDNEAWRSRGNVPTVAIDGAGRAVGWVPARQNVQLLSVRPVAERRRLVFTPTTDGWKVLNGFDRPLTDLSWCSGDGGAWHATGPLAPGAEAVLVAGATEIRPPGRELGLEWESEWRALLGANATSTLQPPGTYSARFASPLFPIPGPGAVDAAPPQMLVFGRVAPGTAP